MPTINYHQLEEIVKSGDLEALKNPSFIGEQGHTLEAVHFALQEVIKVLNPDMLRYLLSLEFDSRRLTKPQLYDKSSYSDGSFYLNGDSLWVPLFKSAANHGDWHNKQFLECFDILANDPFMKINAGITVQFFSEGQKPLHVAIGSGELFLVEKMLGYGAHPNGRTDLNEAKDNNLAPVKVALLQGHGEIAEYLIQKGAVAKSTDSYTSYALKGLLSADAAGTSDAILALRIACHLDGLSQLVKLDWGHDISSPLNSVAALTLTMCKRAMDVEAAENTVARQVQKQAKKTDARKQSLRSKVRDFFSGTPMAIKVPRRVEGEGQKNEQESEPHKARLALLKGDENEFVRALRYMTKEQRADATLDAWALASFAYWRMPPPGGIEDQARNPEAWGCFKAAIFELQRSGYLDANTGFQGLSLLALASALGQTDVCAELIDKRASLNPSAKYDTLSPMTLASKFGHSRLALRLLAAGADPWEGFDPESSFLPNRNWSVHEALKNKDELVFALFEKDPSVVVQRNLQGDTVIEALKKMANQWTHFKSYPELVANLEKIEDQLMVRKAKKLEQQSAPKKARGRKNKEVHKDAVMADESLDQMDSAPRPFKNGILNEGVSTLVVTNEDQETDLQEELIFNASLFISPIGKRVEKELVLAQEDNKEVRGNRRILKGI